MIGLSKGLSPSMMREVSYSSIRMGMYEPILEKLAGKELISSEVSPAKKFASALVSGGIGAAIANPFDLIKTRFQSSLPNDKFPYSSTLDAFRTILKLDGWQGLYKGWVVTCSRAAILTSSQLGSYDSLKNK